MQLRGEQFDTVQKALLSGYPDRQSLALMMRIQLEQNIEAICSDSNQAYIILELITWAESSGQLDRLIEGSLRSNPGNGDLQTLHERYSEWKARNEFLSGGGTVEARRNYFATRLDLSAPTSPFHLEQYDTYMEAWRSLEALKEAGEFLWDEASEENLLAYAKQLRETTRYIDRKAILFEPIDYVSLQRILTAFKEFQTGKARLINLRTRDDLESAFGGTFGSNEQRKIEEQIIQRNSGIMDEYLCTLDEIRISFHRVISGGNRM